MAATRSHQLPHVLLLHDELEQLDLQRGGAAQRLHVAGPRVPRIAFVVLLLAERRLELRRVHADLVLQHDRRLEQPEVRTLCVGAGLDAVHERIDDLVEADDLRLERRHVRLGARRDGLTHVRPSRQPCCRPEPRAIAVSVWLTCTPQNCSPYVLKPTALWRRSTAPTASCRPVCAISSLRRMQSNVRTSCGGPICALTRSRAVSRFCNEVHAFRDAQDDTALDGAVELEAAAGLDALDGAHVVGPVDEDDDRRGGEVRRSEAAASTPRRRAYSCAAGRPLISLHEPPLRVGGGDHEALFGGHEVLRLELHERQWRGGEHEHGRVGDEPAVPVHVGALEVETVGGGAADDRQVAEPLLQGVGHLLLVTEQAVHEQEGERFQSSGMRSWRRRRRSWAKATPSAL